MYHELGHIRSGSSPAPDPGDVLSLDVSRGDGSLVVEDGYLTLPDSDLSVQRTVIDALPHDTDGLQLADLDGDGEREPIVSTEETVYWYDDRDGAWDRDTVAGGHEKLEGVDAGDVNGDGVAEVVALDQSAGDLVVATPSPAQEEPWRRVDTVTVDADAPLVQSSYVLDVDDDGLPEIVYVYEGDEVGTGGVRWADFEGGTVTDGANWSTYQATRADGSWWIVNEVLDLTGDGNRSEVLVTSKKSDYRPSDRTGGLYYLSIPEDPTETWSKTTIEDGVSIKMADSGNLFGDGHSKDVVAVSNLNGGIRLYRYAEDWKVTVIEDEATFYGVTACDLLEGDRDELFISVADRGSRVMEYEEGWQLRYVTTNGARDKHDDRTVQYDIDRDGADELVTVSDGANRLEYLEVQRDG